MEYTFIHYYGSETHVIDLGHDHFFAWLIETEEFPDPGCRAGSGGYQVKAKLDPDDDPFGGMDFHLSEGSICGGYVSWRPLGAMKASGHQLIEKDPLHIEASLACRSCPSHGWIRDGLWVPA